MRMTLQTICAFVAGAFLLLSALDALAANRTVCGTVKFKDIRDNCDGCGDERDGQINPCGLSTYQYAGYLVVHLWDYDPSSNDEYIGSYYINGYGSFCITFPWEGESYHLGETDPDPYFKMEWDWKVQYGWVNMKLYPGGTEPSAISWENNYYLNCTTSGRCWLPSTNYISTSSTSDQTYLANLADSGAHAMKAFGNSAGDARMQSIIMRYCDQGDVDGGCKTGLPYWNDTFFNITLNHADNPYVPPHEMGHVYQSQLFEGDGPGTWSYCKNQTPPPTCSHGLESVEYDKVATSEGWANYVAARAWWDPDDSDSEPCFSGCSFESGVPVHDDQGDTCDDNRGIELLAARGFWDLDDAREDCSSSPAPYRCDNIDLDSRFDIAYNWLHFSNGTSNRQEQEGDYDGTNLWDYWKNGDDEDFWDDTTETWTTLVDLQCQYGMDYN